MPEKNVPIENVLNELKKIIIGKDAALEKIMMAILAGGHILLDDIPGVGKTTMSLAFAKVLGLSQKRLQFTPDVLPSDITGFSMYDKKSGEFRYMAGAAMTNILLADEINRTSPRTQSALLEVMEEGSVTVDSVTHDVPKPFIVIATQNPSGFIGTQELPESQVDRFLIRISLGYPTLEEEVAILQGINENTPDKLQSILDAKALLALQEETSQIHTDKSIYEYIVKIAEATRQSEDILLGISPRGSIAAVKMAQAHALLSGRTYVRPDDVIAILKPVLLHRLVSRHRNMQTQEIFAKLVQNIPLPQITEQKA